jgi:hypothetical protein
MALPLQARREQRLGLPHPAVRITDPCLRVLFLGGEPRSPPRRLQAQRAWLSELRTVMGQGPLRLFGSRSAVRQCRLPGAAIIPKGRPALKSTSQIVLFVVLSAALLLVVAALFPYMGPPKRPSLAVLTEQCRG